MSEHAAPAALPEAELEQLRDETRRAVALELKANFERLWNDHATECEARQAQVEALLTEVEQLRTAGGRCPRHAVALVAACPAYLGEAP